MQKKNTILCLCQHVCFFGGDSESKHTVQVFNMFVLLFVSRREGQSGERSLPEGGDPVPPDPLASIRTPPLLLRGDGEGTGQVARRLPGLCTTRQRW